jgi:hypothetical protein
MLMEIPYLGFLFRCYSGPFSSGLSVENCEGSVVI